MGVKDPANPTLRPHWGWVLTDDEKEELAADPAFSGTYVPKVGGSDTAEGQTDIYIDSAGRALFAKTSSDADHAATFYLTGDATLPSTAPRTLLDAVLTNGSTTLTSASAAFTGQDNGRTVTGAGIPDGTTITPSSATTATMSQAATASGTDVSVTITSTPSSAAPNTNNVALNVISENHKNSAMFLTGTETGRGTLKINHRGYADGADANAAALSIDLQTYYETPGGARSIVGTQGQRARAIFITSTTDLDADGPLGDAMLVRFRTGRDDFRVTGGGKTILGSPTGSSPQGTLDVRAVAGETAVYLEQPSTSGQALLLKGTTGNSDNILEAKTGDGVMRTRIDANANVVAAGRGVYAQNVQVGGTTGTLGSGSGILGVTEATTVPSTNPSGGIAVYVEGGVLKYRDPSGVVRVLSGEAQVVAPSDQGLLAWAYDPAAAVNNSVLAAGVLYLTRVTLRATATITNLLAHVVTAGSGLTAGQCFAALYDSTGARVGVTADQATAWASTGAKTMALTAPINNAAPGTYYVALLANGSTPPAFARSVGTAIGNIGIAAAPFRFSTSGTGQTATPSNVTLGSVGNSAIGMWSGLS